eukprot:18804-Chlamydomonas_euryale.AAC.2
MSEPQALHDASARASSVVRPAHPRRPAGTGCRSDIADRVCPNRRSGPPQPPASSQVWIPPLLDHTSCSHFTWRHPRTSAPPSVSPIVAQKQPLVPLEIKRGVIRKGSSSSGNGPARRTVDGGGTAGAEGRPLAGWPRLRRPIRPRPRA